MLNLVSVAQTLGQDPRLTTLVGNRIFVETPHSEQQGIGIVITLTADSVDTIKTKRSLIDMRIIAPTNQVALQTLYEVSQCLAQALVYDGEYSKFGCFTIVEDGISPPLVDEKGRFEIVKSFSFYHAL